MKIILGQGWIVGLLLKTFCSDMFRPLLLAVFRELTSFPTCVACVSNYVVEILNI